MIHSVRRRLLRASLAAPAIAIVGILALTAPTVAEPLGSTAGPTARVFGRVVDQETGGPVARAEVTFTRVGSPAFMALAKVSNDGTYSETRIPPGQYVITLSTPDASYVPSEEPKTVELAAGVDTKGIDGRMARAWTLKGKVGGPPELVTAIQREEGYLELFSYDRSLASWTPISARYTLYPDFSYTMVGLAAGVYKLQAVVDGEPVNQQMLGSDQPAGLFSRDLEVGGTPVTVHNVVLAHPAPPGATAPIG